MAKITKVKSDYGTSFEIKGTWYKVGFGMEVEPDENDNFEEVKKKLVNTVEKEVEKQVTIILNELK